MKNDEPIDSGAELSFQSFERTLTRNDQHYESCHATVLAGNFQKAFGFSSDQMKTFMTEEHFNHQY